MPRDWGTRALIGTALVAIILPLGATAVHTAGVHIPHAIAIGLVVLWILSVAFGIALIVLPYRVWRLGKHQSDVQFALELRWEGVVFADNTQQPVDIQLEATIHNNSQATAIRYFVESVTVSIADSIRESVRGSGEQLIYPNGSTLFGSPASKA
jgi:hypothetical protein